MLERNTKDSKTQNSKNKVTRRNEIKGTTVTKDSNSKKKKSQRNKRH
jgi:hypothetical protein